MKLDHLSRQFEESLRKAEEDRAKFEAEKRKIQEAEAATKASRASMKRYVADLMDISGLTGDYQETIAQLHFELADDFDKAYLEAVWDLLTHPVLGYRYGSDGLSFRGKAYSDIRGILETVWGTIGEDKFNGNLWFHFLLLALHSGDPYNPVHKTVSLENAYKWGHHKVPEFADNLTIEDRFRLMAALNIDPVS